MKKILLTFLAVLLLSGCGGLRQQDYSTDYLRALNKPGKDSQGLAGSVTGKDLEGFISLYADLKSVDVASRARNVYAKDMYFNDTLQTLRTAESLAHYLTETAARLEDIQVEFLGWSLQGQDAFVRWRMFTRYSIYARDIEVTTLGMTHLRFDESGKIILHQDFWDSTQGLWLHLPIIGTVIERIMGRL